MSHLTDKIQCALDECRMLILGGQVLVSFGALSVLQPRFPDLSPVGRGLCVAALLAFVAAVGLAMWPAAYHRIVCRGADREELHEFTTRVMDVALAPFAAGMAFCLYAAGELARGPATGGALAGLLTAATLAMWYGLPIGARRNGKPAADGASWKINQVLTETRMVLPGAQALLGFATMSVFTEAYERLPEALKAVHLGGLGFISVATVLLMAPAAFHRIAEHGEQTERFHQVASRLLLASMAALGAGMAATVWVVLEVASGSRAAGVAAAAGALAAFYGTWFAWTWAVRAREAAAA